MAEQDQGYSVENARQFGWGSGDPSPERRALLHEKNFQGTFVSGDLCSTLPFRDRTFDTTRCLDVLEQLENDAGAVRELVRVTRERLVVAVPQEDKWMARYGLIFYPYRDPTHLRYYTPGR